MFERATVFSAIFIFIFFGMIGSKYLDHLESKSQANTNSLTSSQ